MIEKLGYALGDGRDDLLTLADKAIGNLGLRNSTTIGGVVAATFSNPKRFPSMAVKIAADLALPSDIPAFDLQMACSAYPYAVYLAGRLSADLGHPVLVVNGDVQSPLVDPTDPATGDIFSDAVTASVVSSQSDDATESAFAFLSSYDTALDCSAAGPIRMDGMKVFTFVATRVRTFLGDFLARASPSSGCAFVPHQANPYMVRQLAKSLGLESRLIKLDESIRNPGGCSIPLTLARSGIRGEVFIAGFGAGYSASAGIVQVL